MTTRTSNDFVTYHVAMQMYLSQLPSPKSRKAAFCLLNARNDTNLFLQFFLP